MTLLENGDEFFPRVFEAIAAARQEVLVETFILNDDEVGRALQAGLIEAAGRGVHVELTVDGYGSAHLPRPFIETLTGTGVVFRVFDPRPRILGFRTNLFRRLHRKLVSIDGAIAFIGGINYAAYHLQGRGPELRQDYAVEVRGPVAREIRHFARNAFADGAMPARADGPLPAPSPNENDDREQAADAEVRFVTRDNGRHRDDIERQYRAAIRRAREDILIANAYFFPGHRLLRDLRRAAKRGVRVRLLLQGKPDLRWARNAARLLYPALVSVGVEIHECCRHPFHGKVAVVDDDWSTVGSSNLDPLSFSLNLEANVCIRDQQLNEQLRSRLEHLLSHHCERIDGLNLPSGGAWRWLPRVLFFHFLRHFPAWAGWLPAHTPSCLELESGPDGHIRQSTHLLD